MPVVRFGLIYCCGLLMAVACSSKNDPLPIDTMKAVIWDMSLADEFASFYVKVDTLRNVDSATNSLYFRVLRMHQVTEQQLRQSIDYYAKHPDKYKVLMDSVNAYGNRQRDETYKRRYQSESQDTLRENQ